MALFHFLNGPESCIFFITLRLLSVLYIGAPVKDLRQKSGEGLKTVIAKISRLLCQTNSVY